MDWDDYRIFLAIARASSVRAAANRLEVSHSTVLRRIERLEEKLETRLFDRQSSGFKLTATGMEVLKAASDIEESIQSIDRSVSGRDSALSGVVTVSSTDTILHPTLQLDFEGFKRQFPNIQLVVKLSYETVDLHKREADIVIRISNNPPESLVGRQVGTAYMAAYATQDYIDNYQPLDKDSKAQLIGFGKPEKWQPVPGWEHLEVAGFYDNILLQVLLTKQRLGVGILPTGMGDSEPNLVRLGEPLESFGIWVLYHPDLRYTSRVKVVRDFLVESLQQKLAIKAQFDNIPAGEIRHFA